MLAAPVTRRARIVRSVAWTSSQFVHLHRCNNAEDLACEYVISEEV